MSESTTVKVPIEINPPQQQTAQEKPAWARRSMHNVRMPRREVEYESQWVDNGPNVELAWRPVEQSTEPDTHPMGEVVNHPPQSYQPPEVNHMSDQQQQPQAPAPPDPQNYDLYDPMGLVQFQHDTHAYMQSQVDARVQAALSPYQGAMREAQLRQDYNAVEARYGQDENFAEVRDVALANCAELQKNGKPFSIIEEYQKANDKTAARPGVRGNAHLPAAFQDKKRGVGMLGRIMHHNQQTGRAKPFNNRNWKG